METPGLRLLLLGSLAVLSVALQQAADEDQFHFKTWILQHEKQYSLQEYLQRLPVFAANRKRVEQHNAEKHSFRLGLNQFSDLTFEEFKKVYLWSEPQNCSATRGMSLQKSGFYPDSIDWRKKGNYVTPVKNQASCYSFMLCWTLMLLADSDIMFLITLIVLDYFQLSRIKPASKGLPSQAFEYIRYNRGIMPEEEYPYKAENGTCHFQPEKAAVLVKDVVNITMNDELGIVQAVGNVNPVSIAFQVTSDFMLYKDGVYKSATCDKTPDKVNHAVLVVGYAQEGGLPYWIVKNSWGPHWGMDGYFNIERGSNMCGLATCASYPIPQV